MEAVSADAIPALIVPESSMAPTAAAAFKVKIPPPEKVIANKLGRADVNAETAIVPLP